MRWHSPAFVSLAAAMLAGCGYQGGAPAARIDALSVQVTDLAAVERGSSIAIDFTIPTVTTENLKLKKEDLELRVGPWPGDLDEWVATSVRIPAQQIPLDKPVAHVEVPAAQFQGKTVAIAVNAHGPGGKTAGWSRFAIVPVVPPLGQPQDLEAADAPNGVALTWHAAAPEFRILRKLVAEPAFVEIGTAMRPQFADETIEYGKTYEYEVQAIEKTGETYAESELSGVTTIRPQDKFAPAVPAGLTAVPGARTIELVWQRNNREGFRRLPCLPQWPENCRGSHSAGIQRSGCAARREVSISGERCGYSREREREIGDRGSGASIMLPAEIP